MVANSDITATLKGLKANHVMVVSDSCYSGTLTRGLVIKKKTPDYVREVVSKKAQVVITSGGLDRSKIRVVEKFTIRRIP